MSDADNQMGGSGSPPESGPPPGTSGKNGEGKDSDVDEASEDSFPASDPPATY